MAPYVQKSKTISFGGNRSQKVRRAAAAGAAAGGALYNAVKTGKSGEGVFKAMNSDSNEFKHIREYWHMALQEYMEHAHPGHEVMPKTPQYMLVQILRNVVEHHAEHGVKSYPKDHVVDKTDAKGNLYVATPKQVAEAESKRTKTVSPEDIPSDKAPADVAPPKAETAPKTNAAATPVDRAHRRDAFEKSLPKRAGEKKQRVVWTTRMKEASAAFVDPKATADQLREASNYIISAAADEHNISAKSTAAEHRAAMLSVFSDMLGDDGEKVLKHIESQPALKALLTIPVTWVNPDGSLKHDIKSQLIGKKFGALFNSDNASGAVAPVQHPEPVKAADDEAGQEEADDSGSQQQQEEAPEEPVDQQEQDEEPAPPTDQQQDNEEGQQERDDRPKRLSDLVPEDHRAQTRDELLEGYRANEDHEDYLNEQAFEKLCDKAHRSAVAYLGNLMLDGLGLPKARSPESIATLGPADSVREHIERYIAGKRYTTAKRGYQKRVLKRLAKVVEAKDKADAEAEQREKHRRWALKNNATYGYWSSRHDDTFMHPVKRMVRKMVVPVVHKLGDITGLSRLTSARAMLLFTTAALVFGTMAMS